jgi:hypothetical protein
MQSLMAMQQRIAGVVRYKIDGDRVDRHHIDNILAQTAELLRAHTRDFKRMAVPMHGMLIAAAVAKDHPVVPAIGPMDGSPFDTWTINNQSWPKIDPDRSCIPSLLGAMRSA